MAGSLRLITLGQTKDGQVEATFELIREGRPGLQIAETFPRNASKAEVVNALAVTCSQHALTEPAPALLLIQQLFEGGQPRSIPDPQPAAPPSPPTDQPA